MAMDNPLEKPDLGNSVVLEEKIIKPNSAAVEEGHVSVEANKDDQIESAKAKMGEVKEENERLKLLLSQLVKNYESLQMRFVDILRQEEAKTSTDTAKRHQENEEEADLVSLSLGRGSGKTEARNEEKKGNGKDDEKPNNDKQGLALGLECKSELEPSGSTEPEEDEPTEIRPPSKVPKTEKNEDVSDQMHLKKPRVSVRARCDTPTMNDGCQWRKYGQKIAKGNPCPRAYYRCTISPTCPVRKQVQRCATDMSVLITTYEGNHNHPLPLSATAMASTTSAAASMLLSQSSTSTSTSSSANLHGLNFNFSQNPRPYYFPNSSISTFNSHPTITLDLTSPHNSSYFARLNAPAKYSSTCLNFSSSSPSSSSFETSWNTSQLNFGAFPNHKDSLFGPLMNLGRQPSPGQMHQSCMQMSNQNQSQTNSHQQSLSETIAAATKVITSDLTFRSALAAALTSFVGNGGGGSGSGSGNERKWGDNTHHTDVENEVSTLGKSPSMVNSHQQQQKQGSLLLFPTSLPFPTSKSTASSAPPEDHN